MAGPSAYEFSAKYAISITFPSTIRWEIRLSFTGIAEGCFQFDQLFDHLNTYSAAKVICVSVCLKMPLDWYQELNMTLTLTN